MYAWCRLRGHYLEILSNHLFDAVSMLPGFSYCQNKINDFCTKLMTPHCILKWALSNNSGIKCFGALFLFNTLVRNLMPATIILYYIATGHVSHVSEDSGLLFQCVCLPGLQQKVPSTVAGAACFWDCSLKYFLASYS